MDIVVVVVLVVIVVVVVVIVVVVVVVVVVLVVVEVVGEVVGLTVIGADVGVAGVVVGLAGRDGLFGRALHTTLQVQPSVLPTFRLYFLKVNCMFFFLSFFYVFLLLS